LAGLIAPAGVNPTLAYLERRAGLKKDSLKEAVRQRDLSKSLIRQLLEGASELGVIGLTSDWLMDERGDPPQKGGNLPPGSPATGRSPAERAVHALLAKTAARGDLDPMLRQQAEVATAMMQRIVERHEVVGTDLRTLLLALAARLERLHETDAVADVYAALVQLSELERQSRANNSAGALSP
jgi:hypothetical protein